MWIFKFKSNTLYSKIPQNKGPLPLEGTHPKFNITLRGDAGHRKIKIHLVWKFLYYQMEDMPLSNFPGKNIEVTI